MRMLISMEDDKLGSRKYDYRALDARVVMVRSVTVGIDWRVYIGAVPGICHADEYMIVVDHGTKVSQEMAEACFGKRTDKLPYGY